MLKSEIKTSIYNTLKKLIPPNIGLFESTKWKNFPIVYNQKMLFDKFNDVNQSMLQKLRDKHAKQVLFSTNHKWKKVRKFQHVKHRKYQTANQRLWKIVVHLFVSFFLFSCIDHQPVAFGHSRQFFKKLLSVISFIFITIFSWLFFLLHRLWVRSISITQLLLFFFLFVFNLDIHNKNSYLSVQFVELIFDDIGWRTRLLRIFEIKINIDYQDEKREVLLLLWIDLS